MNRLEHEFITDSDASNRTRAVRVDRGHNRLFLFCVFGAIVVWFRIVTQEDFHVHFRLSNRLKLRTCKCPNRIKAYEHKLTTSADWLQSEP